MHTFFRLDLINFAVLLVFVINTVFGVIVYSRDTKNKTNESFFFFTLTVIGWCLGMVLYRGFNNVGLATLFCRILYVSAVLIPLALLHFALNFPNAESGLNKWQKYLLPIPTIILIVLSLLPNGLIQSVTLVPGSENIIIFNFPVELLYVCYISVYFLYYFLILGKKFNYAYKDGILHQQLFYIIFGTYISATIGVVSNLLLVMLGIFTYNWLGQVGLLVMIVLISFAILRYHLFNAKIISSELLVGTLWLFILIRIFFAASTSEQILDIALLFVTMIAGLLLVESVKKEVTLREQLETANAGQENLIHIMNHQIKGHLGVDKNIFAELLTDDYGVIPESAKPLIQKGFDESDAGVKYVTAILKGASAESGSLSYEMSRTDIAEIIREVAEKEKPLVEKKGLAFSLEIAAGAYQTSGDVLQLSEAFRNLIENSIYYTPSGSIAISLKNTSKKILFTITDTGVGISDADRPKIFKAGGAGADSLKINTNSSGYGLAFVKGVIEAHKGKVWFVSAGVGKGSTFFVELPVV